MVRRWRKEELRLSQEKAARLIGCARHRLSMIETGRDRPGLDLAIEIELAGGPGCIVWRKERQRIAA